MCLECLYFPFDDTRSDEEQAHEQLKIDLIQNLILIIFQNPTAIAVPPRWLFF
jgi:hypothetical protein